MVSDAPLIPVTASARAQSRGRIPFSFTARVLVALLLGLLWLIPAWWLPVWIAALAFWDVAVLAFWLVDLLRLPAPSTLELERRWTQPLSLGRHGSPSIHVQSHTSTALQVLVVDETPLTLRQEPPSMVIPVPAGGSAECTYTVQPAVRGDITLGNLFLRYRSALGLAERWGVVPLIQTVRVMPDLARARDNALYLIRSRQVEMEKRRRRQRGIGRDFDTLREYRQGDEMRTVCWPATARRHELITRTYQVERSQAVWIVLDAGRLLRAKVYDPTRKISVSKLDYAVDAALALAQVANQSGDRVGLIAYGRKVQHSIGIGRGGAHIRALLGALAEVKSEAAEADHTLAVRTLLRFQTQRALILWITDFAETTTVPEVIEHASLLTRRHLVVFAAVSQADLTTLVQSVPATEREMFRYAAGLEVAERRERLLARLREQGVLALDLTPGALTEAVLNQYLDVKDRSLL